jgi:hypothetical protein
MITIVSAAKDYSKIKVLRGEKTQMLKGCVSQLGQQLEGKIESNPPD